MYNVIRTGGKHVQPGQRRIRRIDRSGKDCCIDLCMAEYLFIGEPWVDVDVHVFLSMSASSHCCLMSVRDCEFEELVTSSRIRRHCEIKENSTEREGRVSKWKWRLWPSWNLQFRWKSSSIWSWDLWRQLFSGAHRTSLFKIEVSKSTWQRN